MQSRQPGGEPLGGPQHVRRAHRPVSGDRRGVAAVGGCRLDPDDGARLVDRDPEVAHDAGQASGQLGRLDPRAMGGPGPDHQPVDVDPGLRRRPFEQLVVGLAPFMGLRDLGPQPLGLGLVGRDVELAALDRVDVDAFGTGDAQHLVDRVVHRLLEGEHAWAPVRRGVPASGAGDRRGQPAAVATTGAVAAEPGLQQHDAQRGVGLLEVVGRPEPGETAADDAHVGIEVTLQGRPRGGKPDVAPPERDIPIDHGGEAIWVGSTAGTALGTRAGPARG